MTSEPDYKELLTKVVCGMDWVDVKTRTDGSQYVVIDGMVEVTAEEAEIILGLDCEETK